MKYIKYIRMEVRWLADREDGKEVWAIGKTTIRDGELIFSPSHYVVTSEGVIRKIIKRKTTALNCSC